MGGAGRPPLRTAARAAAVAFAALLPFLPALGDSLFADDAILIRKARVASPLSAEFYHPGFYHFRPNVVPAFLFSLDAALHGATPAGCHATNLLLHAASAATLFLFARSLFAGRAAPAAAAALLFALHPARAECVAWISGRQDLACALLCLLCLLLFARGRHGASLAALAFALFAKEQAAALPLWLLALAALLPGGIGPARRRALAAAFAVAGGWAAFKFGLFGLSLGAHSSLGPAAVGKTLILYPALFAWPPLSAFPQTISNLALPSILAGCAFLAAALLLARAGDPAARFGLAAAAAALLPVAHLLPIPDYLPHADRFSHLPSLGFALAAAALLDRAARRISPARPARPLAALALALALPLGAASARRAALFTDYPATVRDAHERNPANEAALFLLGRLVAPAEPARAADLFRAALAAAPYANPFFHERLVSALVDGGDLRAALEALKAGFAAHPGHPRLHYQAGRLLRKIGRPEEAAREFAAAREGDPRDVEILRALASVSGTEAVGILETASRLNPWHFRTENNLAAARLAAGDPAAALAAADRATRLLAADPREATAPLPNAVIRATRAAALAALGRREEASAAAREAAAAFGLASATGGLRAELFAESARRIEAGEGAPPIPFEE